MISISRNVGIMNDSKFAPKILNSSPVLSSVVSDTNDAIKDIYKTEKEYADTNDKARLNTECLRILLNYNVIDQDYVNKLVEIGKLKIKY